MSLFSSRLLLVVVALTLIGTVVRATAEGPSWTIYHSWDGGNQYTRRGTLEWKGEEDGFVVNNDAESLTKETVASMLDFGWYHIKIDTVNGDFVLATVPACHLRRANFKDEFSISLPRVAASDLLIHSLIYTPLISPLAPQSCEEYSKEQLVPDTTTLTWTSKAQATLDTPGMTLRTVLPKIKPPPGYSWLSHPNARKGSAGGAAGAGGTGDAAGADDGDGPPLLGDEEGQAQKPFFVRYWYILLPLALANFLPGAGGDTAAPEGGGATTAAADVTTTTTTTTTTTGDGANSGGETAGGGTNKRRGKRG